MFPKQGFLYVCRRPPGVVLNILNILLLLVHSCISITFTTGQGAMNYIKYPGDCYDYNLQNDPNAATTEECATRCDANSDCKAFTFLDGGTQLHLSLGVQCYPKYSFPHNCVCLKEVNCFIKTGIYLISGRPVKTRAQ